MKQLQRVYIPQFLAPSVNKVVVCGKVRWGGGADMDYGFTTTKMVIAIFFQYL